MQRLLRKFDTAKTLVPPAVLEPASRPTRLGVIHFGSTAAAMREAAEMLRGDGIELDLLRVRGFPFGREVAAFLDEHEQVFVVEQNRDAQLRTLLMTECDIDPAQLLPILHYDGTPITARFIRRAIADRLTLTGKPRQPREVLA
jgi:2-oxoglutarate ferredoxin oxidoreductase subunit alpha